MRFKAYSLIKGFWSLQEHEQPLPGIFQVRFLRQRLLQQMWPSCRVARFGDVKFHPGLGLNPRV